MPYLRLTCPELDPEERQKIATRLTDAINDLLFDPHSRISRDELRERTTVHFTPYGSDALFIGGRPPAARRAADVTVELSDWGMSVRQRRRLAAGLTPILANLFGIAREGWHNVNIRFHVYRPSEFAVGGRLLSDLVPLVGRVMRRLAG